MQDVHARLRSLPADHEPCVLTGSRNASSLRSNEWTVAHCCRQFQRYGMFEGHMCFKHKDYLNWLWSSEEISSLSSIGLPLKSLCTQ